MAGLTLTLADDAAAYNLYDLIKAVSGYDQTKPSCRELHLTGDGNNGNGTYVYVGGADLSTTNFGYRLIPDGYRVHRSDVNDVSLADIWVKGSGDNLKVDAFWMYC